MAPTSPDDPTLLRALDTCTQAANVVGSVLISLLVLLIGADVLGRNIFGAPISGVPEMVKLSIVAIVFLQAPQALKAGRMTRSDALINKINARFPKVGGSMETLFDLLAMSVMGAIIYASYPIFIKSWARADFVGAMGDFTAPTWPVKLMVLIGTALLLLQFFARILRRYRKVVT